jgi:HlyD family secretion protein
MKVKRFIKLGLLVSVIAGVVAAGIMAITAPASLPSYRTDRITRGDIAEVVSVTGTLSPAHVVTVGTQVSGQVSKLNVQLNDQVKAGQLLAEIDPTLLLAQIKQDNTVLATTKDNADQASRDVNRTRMLLAQDYVAKIDLEHAEQAYRAAKNAYEGAKTVVERDEANLNYTKIVSPIDGIIISKDVELGQTLTASFQTPNMFKIAGNFTDMKITANFPEAFISKIKVGMPVLFTVDAFPGREFEGKMSVVNLNPNTQGGAVTYTAEMTVNNSDKSLLPGMTAYTHVLLSKTEHVLRIPAVALRFVPPPEHISGLQRLFYRPPPPMVMPHLEKDSKTVYLLRNEVLTPVAVKVGASDDTYVEISGDGIAEGDTVVTGIAPVRH